MAEQEMRAIEIISVTVRLNSFIFNYNRIIQNKTVSGGIIERENNLEVSVRVVKPLSCIPVIFTEKLQTLTANLQTVVLELVIIITSGGGGDKEVIKEWRVKGLF